EEDHQLSLFRCKKSPNPPWYEGRPDSPYMSVAGLTFEDIAVEPTSVAGTFFDEKISVPVGIGGFAPDVWVRLRSPAPGEKTRYALVENKRGGPLHVRQQEDYLRLLRH